MSLFRCIAVLLLSGAALVYSEDPSTGISESMPVDTVNVAVGKGAGRVPAAAPTSDTATPPPLDRLSTISVKCDVEGARVIVNGKYLGATPYLRHGFRPGLYEVGIKKTGYVPFSRMVRAQENDTVYIDCRLVPTAVTTLPDVISAGGDTAMYEPPKGNGTLLVTCSAESATVVVNKANLGMTPFARNGFLPGYYEIEVKKSGYDPFSTTVHLNTNDTVRVNADLSALFGRCFVSSVPPKANVLFDGIVRGTTPFDSTGMRPGLYQVRIELPQYVPWTGQLAIERNRADSVRVSLMSIAERDSVVKLNLRRFKMTRRVIFGAGTVGFVAAGLYYNGKVSQQLELEQATRSRYDEENLGAQEYTARFESLSSIRQETDDFMRRRNACYIAGVIFAAGFAISIPF